MSQRISTVILSLALLAGCGTRSLGGDDDGDRDARVNNNNNNSVPPTVDAEVPDPCAPMDARLPENVRCGDGPPQGWAWTGEACSPIQCACEGSDCVDLYASEGLCYADRAPSCLPPDECLNLDYEACTERRDCQIVWYGGGCIDLDTCEAGGPSDGNWLCWEQGIACVPADHPCTQRDRGDCDGDCYWWERRHEACFGDMGSGDCCVSESYGYCAPVPGAPDYCEPQDVGYCSEPCASVVGYHWDGTFCSPITCCCDGPDCEETYETAAACEAAHGHCMVNACAQAGGYCLYGDFVQPTCGEGYGNDWTAIADHPDACGMGVCCTPCPDPEDPDVGYVSDDPADCATIDFDCMDPDVRHFDNECGCGCITE